MSFMTELPSTIFILLNLLSCKFVISHDGHLLLKRSKSIELVEFCMLYWYVGSWIKMGWAVGGDGSSNILHVQVVTILQTEFQCSFLVIFLFRVIVIYSPLAIITINKLPLSMIRIKIVLNYLMLHLLNLYSVVGVMEHFPSLHSHTWNCLRDW